MEPRHLPHTRDRTPYARCVGPHRDRPPAQTTSPADPTRRGDRRAPCHSSLPPRWVRVERGDGPSWRGLVGWTLFRSACGWVGEVPLDTSGTFPGPRPRPRSESRGPPSPSPAYDARPCVPIAGACVPLVRERDRPLACAHGAIGLPRGGPHQRRPGIRPTDPSPPPDRARRSVPQPTPARPDRRATNLRPSACRYRHRQALRTVPGEDPPAPSRMAGWPVWRGRQARIAPMDWDGGASSRRNRPLMPRSAAPRARPTQRRCRWPWAPPSHSGFPRVWR